MTDSVYKILTQDQWQDFAREQTFRGSPDDVRDGFIHLSSQAQLKGTLDKHYRDTPTVVIARFLKDRFGENLRWEVSRGGAKFPHLYAPLKWAHLAAYGSAHRSQTGWALEKLDGKLWD